MSSPVVIVDYGASNLRSVARAVAHVDRTPNVTADPADIDAASVIILPGVGAACDTMSNLASRGLIDPILAYIRSGRPFLGVCMGLQALLDWSEEGGQDCLGVFAGKVRRFSSDGRKVPHMGWNTVEWTREHPVHEGIPSGSPFYFVHSYYPDVEDAGLGLGLTEYGVTFPSALASGNVVATQFHPEKSSDHGLQLYQNYIRWARGSAAVPTAVAGRTA